MKKLLIFLFSLLISFNSYGAWTKVTENAGDRYFIDRSTIKEKGGYVYFWELEDLKIMSDGVLSVKAFSQVDCDLYQFKVLSVSFHSQGMGKGSPIQTLTPPEKWHSSPPNTIGTSIINYACEYVN
mgnify:CR=1 FL=1